MYSNNVSRIMDYPVVSSSRQFLRYHRGSRPFDRMVSLSTGSTATWIKERGRSLESGPIMDDINTNSNRVMSMGWSGPTPPANVDTNGTTTAPAVAIPLAYWVWAPIVLGIFCIIIIMFKREWMHVCLHRMMGLKYGQYDEEEMKCRTENERIFRQHVEVELKSFTMEVGSGICQLALAEDEGACDDAQDTLNDIEMHTDADIENGKSSDCDVGSVAGVNNDQSESISSNGILLSLPCPGVAAKSESDGTNRDAQCMSVSPYATSTAEETPSCDISSVEDDGNNDCRLVPNRCAICLDDYQVKDKVVWSSNVLCNHVFHYDCIMDWFVRNESNVRQRRRRHPSGRVNQQQQQVEGDGLNILAPGNNAPVLERDAIMLSTADVTRLSSSLSICFDFDLSCPCCRQSFVDPNHKPAGSRDERMIISNNNASLIEEAQSQQISKLQEESGSDNGDICDEASDLSLETAP